MLALLAYMRKALAAGLSGVIAVATADGFPMHNLTGSEWAFAVLSGVGIFLATYNVDNGPLPAAKVPAA